ncbi:MAG: glycosyltransferase family 2 protein [Phototrophicaceae bacterium]|nr:putative glycosyltransferase [Anaerolineae bacterium]MBW7878191.1 glycosyltransferase family 2 protein [Anaerolineae bacterium]MDL1915684.1 glycosyltransferase family 2 protein [Anaerolineae bacterium CFX4]RIK22448.1 MAG: glycosyltransferase [Chloroflexota bacterium]
MTARPTYSIVAPVYNEEGNVPRLVSEVARVMESTNEPWELILVNDGSRDKSLDEMRAEAARNPRIKIVNFARNFGHQVAVTAGIDFATGRAVVLIDADLQDPPEVILEMIERWKAGYEVVYAVRSERKGESWFKRATAKLFYRVIYRITDVHIPLDTGDFRLMDERVAHVLRTMREHNRFIRGMTSWVGFRQTGVQYVREARTIGETKYPLRKMMRFAWDAVTGFSFFPLQVMIYVSLALGLLAVLAIPIIALLRISLGPDFFGGQATTIVVLLLIGSFQLFFLFVLGQYVARIYDETRGRPLYVVASTENVEPDKDSGRDQP